MKPNGGEYYGQRVLTGPEAMRAASQLQREEEARQLWPYSWVYPPRDSIRREPAGSIAAPAVATQAQILAFTVPTNFNYVWSGLLLVFDGGGFVPGSGDIVWVVDVDTPVSGTAPLTSSPLPDLQSILFPRGSYVAGPWKFSRPETIKSGQTLRAKVTTTAAINPGAPNYFSGLFAGWLVPAVR